MQRSLWRAGLQLADFPSNKGNYILHRGRSGVAAAQQHYPHSSYAKVTNHNPHYMGIANGENIWKEMEQSFSNLLQMEHENELIEHLSRKMNVLAKSSSRRRDSSQ